MSDGNKFIYQIRFLDENLRSVLDKGFEWSSLGRKVRYGIEPDQRIIGASVGYNRQKGNIWLLRWVMIQAE